MHMWMCVCVSACLRISTLYSVLPRLFKCVTSKCIYTSFSFILFPSIPHLISALPGFAQWWLFTGRYLTPWFDIRTYCSHTSTHRCANTSSYEYTGDLSEATVKSMTCVLKNWESFTLICFPGLAVSCCWAHSSTNRYKVTVSSLSVREGVLTVLNSFRCHTNVLAGSDLRQTASIFFFKYTCSLKSKYILFKQIVGHFRKYTYLFSCLE